MSTLGNKNPRASICVPRVRWLAAAVLTLLATPGTSCAPRSPSKSVSGVATSDVVHAGVPLNEAICSHPESEDALQKCMEAAHRESEKNVHDILAELYARASYQPEWVEELKVAQARWEAFRDAECAVWTYDSRGGTAFGAYWLECLTVINRQRAGALSYLKENP